MWEGTVALVRRFYVTVPLVAVAAVGGTFYIDSISPEYHGSAAVVLLGPTAPANPAVPAPANPYVHFGSIAMANTLQVDMADPRTSAEISGAGNSTDFTVTVDGRSSILTIATTAATRARALSTANQLVSIIQADVTSLQSAYGTDTTKQITTRVLSAGAVSAADSRAQGRARLITVSAFVVLAIIVSLMIDRKIRRRREGSESRLPSPRSGASAHDAGPPVAAPTASGDPTYEPS